jgi:hypothetical protein
VVAPFDDPAWKQQMIQTHLKSGLSTDDSQIASIRSIASRFLEDAPLMGATAIALWMAGRAQLRVMYPVVLWLITSILVLSQANPLWGHHRVMFSIPAAILCASAVRGVMRRLADDPGVHVSRHRKILIGAVGVAVIWGAGNLMFSLVTLGRVSDDTMSAETIAELRARKDHVRWVVSDDPHLVHSAGMVVVPESAVISLKRLQKDLSEQRLLEIIEQYPADLLLFARHRYSREFERTIALGYDLVLRRNDGRIKLFARKPSPTATTRSDEETPR